MVNLFINFTDEISECISNACHAYVLFVDILPEYGDSLVSETLL